MDLTTSQGKYAAAVKEFGDLKNMIRHTSGPHALEAIMEPTTKLLHGRSELVRDVVISIAQSVIQEEALKFLSMSEEEKAEAAAFLASNPTAYLRRLEKTIVDRARVLPVADKLGKIIEKL